MVERRLHPHHFFNKEEKEKIIEAIRSAEGGTSGEIRIHLAHRGGGDVMERGKRFFRGLRLHQRKHRNAVLIYLSLADRSFAVLGDEGIHQRVGDAFWKEAAESMRRHFAEGRFLEGFERAVHAIGQQLKRHFPLST